MHKSLSLFVIVLLLCFYSCKKDSGGKENPDNTNFSSLIIGKWLVTKEHAKIYTMSGALVKDTTDIYANDRFNNAWYEIYNKDGNGYVTTATSGGIKPDTTSFITYSIAGNEMKIYEEGEYNYSSTILILNSTSMQKEDTYTTPDADSRWNLPANTPYKYVEDYTYTKQ